MNNWLTFDDEKLNDYLNRELEITEKGQVKSTTTNLITVLVNPRSYIFRYLQHDDSVLWMAER